MTDTTIRPAVASDSPALFTLARAFATSFTVEQAAFDRTFGNCSRILTPT